MAKTWHDPESIKLWSRGPGGLRKSKTKTFSQGTPCPLTSEEWQWFATPLSKVLLKLASIASFEHLCVRIRSSSKAVVGVVAYCRGNASFFCIARSEETLQKTVQKSSNSN